MTQANIDPQPGPSGPPQDPSKPSYKQLSDEAARAEIVFRVHSEMSASPLHWTGRAETSGFCSPNPHLASSTPGAYAACSEPIPLASIPSDPSQAQPPAPAPATPPPVSIPLDDEMNGLPSTQDSVPKSTQGQGQGHVEVIGVPWISFERDPSIRQSLVDHCTRRTRPSHNWDWSGPDMAADDYSSWISCTGSLRWAVWEAAHRSVHAGEEQVDIAIIGVIAEADDPASISPHGGPGKRPPFQRIRAGASGEVTLAPLLPSRDHQRYGRGTGDRARMTNSEKEAVANAIYMAHSSEEVLFYGRIFTSSVRANLTFTRDHSPSTSPREFFDGASGSTAWVDDSAWDPMRDSYDAACKKIKDNAGPARAPFKAAPKFGPSSVMSGGDAGWGARSTLSASSGPSRSSTSIRASAEGWGAPPAPPAAHAAHASMPARPAGPQPDASGWGAPPYAQPAQPHHPQPQSQQASWPSLAGSRPEPAPAPQTQAQRTYASATSKPANHYTTAGGSLAPSFLSSTNAVPLGRRGGGGGGRYSGYSSGW